MGTVKLCLTGKTPRRQEHAFKKFLASPRRCGEVWRNEWQLEFAILTRLRFRSVS